MITTDEFTFRLLKNALFDSYTSNREDIELRTGYSNQFFKELDEKYKIKKDNIIADDDLPVFVKALEWMLVVEDDSDILQIDRADGLKLLELLKNDKNDIKREDWSMT